MLLHLSIKNLKKRKFRSILGILSITIGTACLLISLSLSQGIESSSLQEIESKLPLDQITVKPNIQNTGVISLINKNNKLTEQTVSDIEKIKGVEKIHKEIQFNSFASLEAGVLGFNFRTDTMIFGLSSEFLDIDPENWNTNNEPYPVIIPRKILDLYNLTLATQQNLPTFSEDILIGKKLTLYPNISTFFPNKDTEERKIELEVIGFSDKINIIGIGLPYELVEELNNNNNDKNKEKPKQYTELFVKIKNPAEVKTIAAEIEKLGHSTQYLQKNFENVEEKLTYIYITLYIISIIILITSAISIISTFLATINERKKEIGLLQAIGASQKNILHLILYEAGIIGVIGSLSGITVAIITSTYLNKIISNKLSNSSLSDINAFELNTKIILFTILFGTTLSILSAYIPAKKASKSNPINNLR